MKVWIVQYRGEGIEVVCASPELARRYIGNERAAGRDPDQQLGFDPDGFDVIGPASLESMSEKERERVLGDLFAALERKSRKRRQDDEEGRFE